MRTLLALATLLAMPASGFASGGLSCEVDDDVLKLEVPRGVTRGMGSPVFNFGAKAEILDTKAPVHLRSVEFGASNLPQYWLDQTTLNLLLYRETEDDLPHGYVEITIQAQPRADEDGVYSGAFSMTVYDVGAAASAEPLRIEHAGEVSCFVE